MGSVDYRDSEGCAEAGGSRRDPDEIFALAKIDARYILILPARPPIRGVAGPVGRVEALRTAYGSCWWQHNWASEESSRWRPGETPGEFAADVR